MKKVLSMGLIIATSFIVGCGVSSNVEAKSEVDFSRIGGDSGFEIYRDNETGVHYIKYSFNNGVGMCPRYNKIGSIYID